MNENNSVTHSGEDEATEFSFFDMLQIVVDHLRLLIIVPLVLGVLATVLVMVFVKPTYESRTRFLAPQPPQGIGAGALNSLGIQGLSGGLGATLRNPSDIYVSFMNSNKLRDPVIEQFELHKEFKGKTKDEIRQALGAMVGIKLSKENIFTISVVDKSPQRAADIANTYPANLRKIMAEFAVQEAISRRDYYLTQTANLKTKIQVMESELKSTGIDVDVLKLDMGNLVAEMANLKASISSAEIHLRSMRNYLAPTAPEYKQALSERDSLQYQLDKLRQAKPVRAQDDKYQEKFREYVYNLELLGLLSKQAELAQFDANKNEVHLQVLDVAEPSERKFGPSYRNTLLLTTAISGFLLLIFIFIRHAFRSAAEDQKMAAKFKRLRNSLHQAFLWKRKAMP